MTIRRRLSASFLTILTMFAANQGIQVWSTARRAATMATLDRAMKRQVLIASVGGRVSDLQKQISLIGQIEEADAPLPASGRESLASDIAAVSGNIRGLVSLSDPSDRLVVAELDKTFNELAEDWRRFYDYVGVEPVWAVAFQVKAEPLSRRVLQLLPQIERLQNQRVLDAEERFATVSRVTQRVSIGIFAVSMLLAIAIAYLLGRYLQHRLGALKLGAAMIGQMNLEHRIVIDSRDELGLVAESFNEMAERLTEAHQELKAANTELLDRNAEIDRQRHVSESLLLNILPAQVASELKTRGEVAPKYFEDVTILFTDFVGFTLATEKLAASEVVGVLHSYFKVFDEIAARYGLEKLKTIGDSYFCAGGLPTRTPSHPVDATMAAFEMIREVEQHVLPNGDKWRVRIGLHTGPVIAGVVGTKKFAFDVWGDTVNRASRIESAGASNKINVSADVQRRIKDFFTTESRGRVMTKDKTELEMFLVSGILPSLTTAAGYPPPAFAERYRTYFDKDIAAFPEFLLPSSGSHSSGAGRR